MSFSSIRAACTSSAASRSSTVSSMRAPIALSNVCSHRTPTPETVTGVELQQPVMRRILIVLCVGWVVAACSTSAPVSTPPSTTTSVLTPTVLAKVDRTIRASGVAETFSYQRVEAAESTLIVHTGLFWKRENADLALGLCGYAAGGLIDAGAEKASVKVVAGNGDNLTFTLGSAGTGGKMNGSCRKTSAFK